MLQWTVACRSATTEPCLGDQVNVTAFTRRHPDGARDSVRRNVTGFGHGTWIERGAIS